jgi:hypothetical protein
MAMLATAALLLKLSKHIAFLTSLLVLGRASHRVDIDPVWIFGAAALASLLLKHQGQKESIETGKEERPCRAF